MAVITPNTDLYLLKVPLEIDDINQLDFTTKQAQFNYFNSLSKIAVDDFTYQRKDDTIRFPINFDEIITYNYVMYRNDAYSDKWFYAFITGMEYVNDNMTRITIKTDTWQTWMFDLTFKPVLIDREHANTDVAGDNTLPEGLELGEMVCNGSTTNFGGVGGTNMSSYCTIVEVSQIENTGESATLSYAWASGTHDATPNLNNVYRGTIPLILIGSSAGTAQSPDAVIRVYDFAGLGDSVINVYMLPLSLVGTYNLLTISAQSGGTTKAVTVAVPNDKSGTFDLGSTTFTKPTTVNGYTPKNKKVLTYPFCYFNVSNNSGSCLPYRYEDFPSTIAFSVEGTFGISGSTKAIPQNYLNINTGNALDYSITGPKFPVCSWNSDSYTNWLTQNAVNMETQWKTTMVSGLLGVGGSAFKGYTGAKQIGGDISPVGMASLGAVGAGVGLAGEMISLAREQHLAKTQANMVPDQVKGNLGAGDFVWAKYRSPFTYMPMSIKYEYAVCIDQYFSQYGYKCNRVKLPNIRGRRNWNYVKTVGCYIDADIPQNDLAEIKAMFDRGITFWHNPATFADYTQNNDII